MDFLFTDNAKTTLAVGIAASSSPYGASITVATGTGALFATPDPGLNQVQAITITDGVNTEICRLTSRTGDTLIVDRPVYDGLFDFAVGAKVEARLTSYVMNQLQQRIIQLESKVSALELLHP